MPKMLQNIITVVHTPGSVRLPHKDAIHRIGTASWSFLREVLLPPGGTPKTLFALHYTDFHKEGLDLKSRGKVGREKR